MTRALRKGKSQKGLILANGGVLTYQHAICLSNRPRRDGSAYPDRDPLPSHIVDVPVPTISAEAEGEAIIEVKSSDRKSHRQTQKLMCFCKTYTVEYGRNGAPSIGFIVGRLTSNDHRFVANADDSRTLEQLSSRVKEPIGRIGWVRSGEKGKNLFVFEQSANL